MEGVEALLAVITATSSQSLVLVSTILAGEFLVDYYELFHVNSVAFLAEICYNLEI